MERRKEHISTLISFLKKYEAICNSYVSDFFLLNHWSLVPDTWKEALHEASLAELASLLSPETWKASHVWPLSLLAFRQSVFHLALERQFRGENSEISAHGQCLALDHCLRKHVKPKKQHEIIHLSKTVNKLAESVGCNHIVDVGAGQGHLSRCLNFAHGHQITTIEATACHTPRAQKFDEEVAKSVEMSTKPKRRKKNQNQSTKQLSALPSAHQVPEVRHLTGWIDPNISNEEFLQRFNFDPNEKFMLTGLHTCGDLTPTLLRLFVGCENVCAIASVSCCYMKLSTRSQSCTDTMHGYPMSNFLNHHQKHSMSWETLELGVHFADAYHDRLLSESEHLHSHAYRAALQEIIHHKAPDIQHGTIKLTCKNIANMSFETYVQQSLRKLGLDESLPEELIQRAKEERLSQWKDVVAYFTLRLSLAPLIESLILLDRILYLEENGIGCIVQPVFNPRLSPRNFAILGKKKS